MRSNKILTSAFLIVTGVTWQLAYAERHDSAKDLRVIVKEVNGEAITENDIEMRSRIIALSMGRQYTKDFAASVRTQVLEVLVNDMVKRHEISRVKKRIKRTEIVSKKNVLRAIDNIAQRAGFDTSAFKRMLEKHGIPFEVFKEQIMIQMAWSAIVNDMFASNIEISDNEALKEQESIRKQLNQKAYLLSRIYLPVEREEDAGKIRALVGQIYGRLAGYSGSANFPMLAQQFSRAPEAVNGGWLGWVTRDRLSVQEARVVDSLALNTVSEPVNIGNAYVILMLHEKKEEGEKYVTEIKIQKVMLRASGGQITSDVEAQSVFNEAQRLKERMSPVSKIVDIASASSNIELGPIETVAFDEMRPQLKRLIEKAPAKSVSDPILFPQGAILVIVWDRNSRVIAPPPLEAIKDTLIEKRLGMMSEQYFRELKKMAYIR
ncbi:MAG: peptidylprolyl isomerase [Holosporales bacterium]|jgi:peptidyl-prolyl cis-trans isomerase SurA|nr:peptidylprolyl isomerase [Holosporales bacterium]